ncbi:unnamed protein product [Chondrus crispus]|uniref:cysteine--tRNA ligase n=1 Tax=Chondrus crispus TaxID=2769 RepID=R7Q7M4_CHOCR|nr:unnamed protein product [Chondrus crispus]CDF34527.1 unnamed protein product [Chondrus crispus]|eukprot:XP_005714346.1 unnamed protein product [Chondrus crispus]
MGDQQGYYPWQGPDDPSKSRLKVLNSFTGQKEPFVPRDGGNRVSWYICGPTVYDSAHVGHASNYVRFDVVRRILSDYFGYDLVVQMNVTDIDDKIIKRATERNLSFEVLAHEFETEFMEDMDSLNVKRPDFLTRVSEYIPEVIDYIRQIIQNGFAYESAGSVYFDTGAFTDAGHNYGKLEPGSVGNQSLIAEGEGALTAADACIRSQKKAPGDFVLWKKSKKGEPSWESPWGPGRPGWHIECSAMASNVLGPIIDIHAGGVDLRFPHHSNEVAQAEAYHSSHNWVNYFLHAGHLHIEGLKMSKSLKNFITIRNCLQRYNARQMRLAFLCHRYDAPMIYAEHAMEEAVSVDRTFIDFFGTLKATIREVERKDPVARVMRPLDMERELSTELERAQETIHNSLADNFDTPSALREIQNLVRSTNAYMAHRGTESNNLLLEGIGGYISKMLSVFGLSHDNAASSNLRYGSKAEDESSDSTLANVLDAFCQFRDTVRSEARKENSAGMRKILSLSDSVRDDDLPKLGVRLEDRGVDQPAMWKLEEAETLVMEIQRKREAEASRREEKERKRLAREAKLREDLEKGRLSPEVLFKESKEYAGKYRAFDEQGMPTMDANGEGLSKSALKSLAKARTRQEKLHAKFLAANGSQPT